jgi:hypothetical protein
MNLGRLHVLLLFQRTKIERAVVHYFLSATTFTGSWFVGTVGGCSLAY